MLNNFILEEMPDASLDTVLGFDIDKKTKYFTALASFHYKDIDEDSNEFIDILEMYMSSYYVEKLYRSNRFFSEKFTPIYTKTGIIRNIVSDMYYNDDDLLIH